MVSCPTRPKILRRYLINSKLYLPEIKEVMARKRVAMVVDLFCALLVIIKQVTPVQTKITESPILTP